MAILTIKKVGNHWYPNVQHMRGVDISISDKVEKYLNILSKGEDSISFIIEEMVYINTSENVIYFNEEDITRYFITDDNFNLRFEINNRTFELSSNLYFYITQELELNFHTNIYKLNLC